MSGELDKSQFLLPLDQPVVTLDVATAFSQLSNTEKLYAHFLSQAAWTGGLITLLQTSPESGPVFVLLHKLFSAQHPSKFRQTAIAHGFSDTDVMSLFVYAAGVFTNAGNYKTGRTCLGFPPEGCTTYFSSNCTSEDSARVQNWLKKHNLESYNTRCFKSILASDVGELQVDVDGKYKYRLVQGDYCLLMKLLNRALEKALPYTNQTELFMLQSYIRSFRTGSINEHKQGSRLWIQNKTPAIETYIGFIETYRDPAGVRGEFEAFVAMVNRPMSKKFKNLVENAQQFLGHLPWPKDFEKDHFLRPDFTSLDVLSFAGSSIPAGINIPNYDDIRQSEGFKNVALGNVIPASYQFAQTPFLSVSDVKLLREWRVLAFELQVGLHELLGHGSGKLFRKEADGNRNFPRTLINPVTGNPITSCYQHGDTFDSRFGSIGAAFEECRAEAVGLYLSLEPSVLEIFGYKDEDADDIKYVNWLALVWAGAGRSLEMWEPGRGWLQAHAQARFVITKVLMQVGVVRVTQPHRDDLLITLDRNSISGPGRNAISHFLLQLQVFKSLGDVQSAKRLFGGLSEVDEPWLTWRSIIISRKQPRNMLLQPNTELVNDTIMLKTYKPHVEEVITSWLDRFQDPEQVYSAIIELARGDFPHFT
ncbi:hypothetical protein RN001_000044 [Aquatica leii]|uniref:Dipeptidyl peptidase 3 n=1 Tax=Aquatica leii TaxID=1421715 RepID=A0AAN7QLT9_9COLE|nr:hypothetical protein RN001_000044 [Aquatica leii]